MTGAYSEILGRAAVYELLSLAFLYPGRGASRLLREKAGQVATIASNLGWKSVGDAAGKVNDRFAHLTDASLLEQYIDVFGHSTSGDCPPYEGEYEQAHVFQMSHTLADLTAFYGAFGVAPNLDAKERWDHVSTEMEFMQLLVTKEAYAQQHSHGEDKVRLCREAQEAFLRDHLATWIMSFVRHAGRKAGSQSAYGQLTGLLGAHMNAEFNAIGLKPAPPDQVILPLAQEDELSCEDCPIMASVEQGSKQ